MLIRKEELKMEKVQRIIAHFPGQQLAEEFMKTMATCPLQDKFEIKMVTSKEPTDEEYQPWGLDTSRVTSLVTLWSTSKDVLEFKKRHPELRWVHSLSAGVDKLIGPELKRADVTLTNAKGAFSPALAEFVMFQMLWFEKQGSQFQQLQRGSTWQRISVGKLGDKTLGIVGFGDIGGHCAAIAKRGFGMRVLGVKNDPTKLDQDFQGVCDEVLGFDAIDRVLAESDYVLATLPLVATTKGLFDAKMLRKMKKSAVFMNIGRGQNVVEQDLAAELKAGTIRGAFLDVFEKEPLPADSELWGMDNVFITSHCCDNLGDILTSTIRRYISNLDQFLEGKPFKHTVDQEKGY